MSTRRTSGLAALRRDLRKLATPARAKSNAWFFKTGKGEYGYGDVFLGVTVPQTRAVVKAHADLPMADIKRLLDSKIHEERLAGFHVLVMRFTRGDEKERRLVHDFYVANAERANNWDLVDTSAPYIVGLWLVGRPTNELTHFAKAKNLWRKRIAIVGTLGLIRAGKFRDTFRITDLLMNDTHDLLHKACGWMLREVGKRDKKALVAFLRARYTLMPRTMLRYAIERFPKSERDAYLKGTV